MTKNKIPFGHTARPNNRAPFAKNVIVVTSGKGGVGKSTVTVNLASQLAQMNFRVGILDADVYGPSVPRLLQVEDERIRWNDNNKIEPIENFGMKIMSVGLTTPDPDTPLIWRSSVSTSAMIQLLDDVEWGELDFLVIDMPPGTGDTQLTMAQELRISAAIVVTTPQSVATDDVRRAIRMLKEIKAPIAGVIENMSHFVAPDTGKTYFIFGQGGGKRLAHDYEIPFLGEIPLDIEVRESSDAGMVPAATGSDDQKEYFSSIVGKLLAQGLFQLPTSSESHQDPPGFDSRGGKIQGVTGNL
jgi:ATP-binding protein involved in chromosome partitioning